MYSVKRKEKLYNIPYIEISKKKHHCFFQKKKLNDFFLKRREQENIIMVEYNYISHGLRYNIKITYISV